MRAAQPSDRGARLCILRDDVLSLSLCFSDVLMLALTCTLCRRLRKIASLHEHWRWFVLQSFGVYYEDYMKSVNVRDPYRWRRLFIYIQQVHHNIDHKKGVKQTLPQLLRPASTDAPLSSERHSRRRARRYRGSLELADNCNVFFWENGQIIQVVRAKDGMLLREIDTGQRFRRYFHRLANTENRLFVCLNDCIKVWECGPLDFDKPPRKLPPAKKPPNLAQGRPLELLVHRRRLVLVESNCCLLWDTDSLKFVSCIQHDDSGACPSATTGDVLTATRIHVAAVAQHALPSTAAPVRAPVAVASGAVHPSQQALEVGWMGDLILTWFRGGASKSLKVWTLDGHQRARLLMDSPLVQVDVARVTWVSVKMLDHFILASLDSRSVVSLWDWDPKVGFNPIFRFYCGCEIPFDLVLTQDFMAVVNDNVVENRLELCFWKLWFHPNFEASVPAAEAARARQASVDPGCLPAGARLTLPATTAGGHVARQGNIETVLRVLFLLQQELRPNAFPMKRLLIPDVDSYFASYRNLLNVCSFHKSGQESLSVYRSTSLQKKVFFPPAKHIKFEEWLALQVHNDGSVVLHDFRPQQVAFDELAPDDIREPESEHKDSEPSRRRIHTSQHSRCCVGSRSRGR